MSDTNERATKTEDESELAQLVDRAKDQLEKERTIDVERFASAHPKHADELRELLPLLLDLEREDESSIVPSSFGRFKLMLELGRGGMGVVHLARDQELGRTVALKRLHRASAREPKFLERFQREARATAKLNHPNIVSLFDAGECDGKPYYTMEFVAGRTLEDLLDDQDFKPSFTEIALLVGQIADGVAHAHARGILHRDIKPANIIVDGAGKPLLLDLGICSTDDELDLTQDGFVGTLRYSAPEQLDGQVDERTDIYALGLVLYELIARERAFGQDSRASLLHAIAEVEPRRLTRLNRSVPSDLETITRKAHAKLPENRYESAARLARDLEAFASGLPVSARAPGPLYLARLFARRHKALCAIVLISTCALSALALRYVLDLRSAEGARRAEAYAARLAAAQASIALGETASALDHLGRAPKERLGWEWHHLRARADQSLSELQAWPETAAAVLDLEVSPDGRHVALAGVVGVSVWDLASREWVVREPVDKVVRCTWAPDGRELAVVIPWAEVQLYGIGNGCLKTAILKARGTATSIAIDVNGATWIGTGAGNVWRLDREATDFEHELSVVGRIAWLDHESEQGRDSILVVSDLGEVARRSAGDSWQVLPRIGNGETIAVLCRDGNTTWIADGTGGLRAIDITTGRTTLHAAATGCTYEFGTLIQGKSQLVVAGADEKVAHVYDVRSGRHTGTLAGHSAPLRGLGWSEVHGLLFSADEEGETRVWDPRFRGGESILRGHESDVETTAMSADGRLLATGGQDGLVIVWDLDRSEPWRVFDEPPDQVEALEFSGSSLLTAACWNGALYRFDLDSGECVETEWIEKLNVHALTLDREVLWLSTDDTLYRFDEAHGRRELSTSVLCNEIVVSKDGDLIVLSDDLVLHRIDADSGEVVWPKAGDTRFVGTDVAYSPERDMIAVIKKREAITLVDAENGVHVADLRVTSGGQSPVSLTSVAFGPTPNRVSAGSADGALYIWSLEGTMPVLELDAHEGRVTGMRGDEERQRVITCGINGEIRVFNRARSEAMLVTYEEQSVLGDPVVAARHRARIELQWKLERVWSGLESADIEIYESAVCLGNSLVRSRDRIRKSHPSIATLDAAMACMLYGSESAWRKLAWSLERLPADDPHRDRVENLLAKRGD